MAHANGDDYYHWQDTGGDSGADHLSGEKSFRIYDAWITYYFDVPDVLYDNDLIYYLDVTVKYLAHNLRCIAVAIYTVAGWPGQRGLWRERHIHRNEPDRRGPFNSRQCEGNVVKYHLVVYIRMRI